METIDYAYLILIVLTAILVFVTHQEEKRLRQHIKQYKLITKSMDETIHSLNDFKEEIVKFNDSTYSYVQNSIKKMNEDLEKINKLICKDKVTETTKKAKTTRKRTTKKEVVENENKS